MIERSWFLLLAANDYSIDKHGRRKRRFIALPCDTLEDLASQLSLQRKLDRN
jgi:hypothetical protein